MKFNDQNLVISKKNNNNRIKILCFISYYLPGFRSGGPTRTIANFVEQCGDDFEIFIITRDHDFGSQPYQEVTSDSWTEVGKAKVYYASQKQLTLTRIYKLLNCITFDVLYLNSFFSWKFTGLPLLLRRFSYLSGIPCVIAPRGEFSINAISYKNSKKRIYIWLTKLFNLNSKLIWQASSSFEADDIHRGYGVDSNSIYIAPDLPSYIDLKSDINTTSFGKQSPLLRVVFLSRISPIKNLLFAIQVLALVQCQVVFTIYGPIEDQSYWERCKELLKILPNNISVTYAGEIYHHEVADCLASHDLFFFPSLGENYGHVIFEALSSGLLALISDQTPWQDLSEFGVGWVLPLNNPKTFALCIDEVSCWSSDDMFKARLRVKNYVIKHLENKQLKEANKMLFISAASNGIKSCSTIDGKHKS